MQQNRNTCLAGRRRPAAQRFLLVSQIEAATRRRDHRRQRARDPRAWPMQILLRPDRASRCTSGCRGASVYHSSSHAERSGRALVNVAAQLPPSSRRSRHTHMLPRGVLAKAICAR